MLNKNKTAGLHAMMVQQTQIEKKSGTKFSAQAKTVRLFDTENPLQLISGEQLFPVDVAFETYGTLSPACDNAILVVHALTGDAHATSWPQGDDKNQGWWQGLIGRGKALEPDRYFIICSNLLGSCYGTTGPTSINPQTDLKYGMEFPPISTIDMAQVQKALLDYLQIPFVQTIIGGSLGAMVTWQLAVTFPELARSVIPVAGTTAASPWVIGLNEVARQAILLQSESGNGIHGAGLKLARMIAMISYRSEISFAQRFKRERVKNHSGNIFDPENRFQVENYLHYQGKKLVKRFDPFSYLTLTKAMDWHDVSIGFSDTTEALNEIKASVLTVGIDTDRLFTAREMKQTAAQLTKLNKSIQYREIKSIHGHDAFLIEYEQLNQIVASFLEEV